MLICVFRLSRLLNLGLDIVINYSKHKKSVRVEVGFDLS